MKYIVYMLTLSIPNVNHYVADGFIIRIEWTSKFYVTDYSEVYYFISEDKVRKFETDSVGSGIGIFQSLIRNGARVVEQGPSVQNVAGCCEFEELGEWYLIANKSRDSIPVEYTRQGDILEAIITNDSLFVKMEMEYGYDQYKFEIARASVKYCLCNPYSAKVDYGKYHAVFIDFENIRRPTNEEVLYLIDNFNRVMLKSE